MKIIMNNNNINCFLYNNIIKIMIRIAGSSAARRRRRKSYSRLFFVVSKIISSKYFVI